jgi:hypothetical protein
MEDVVQNDSAGFVIIRYARDETDNVLSHLCYESIRRFHPDTKIIVFDDSSEISFETTTAVDPNLQVVRSCFGKGKGEFGAWYFYYLTKPFERVCMLHDSMALTQPFDFRWTDHVHWCFRGDHLLGNHNEEFFANALKPKDMYHEMCITEWRGCFGVAGYISHVRLEEAENTYGLFSKLIDHVKTRTDRMAIERIFGFIVFKQGVRSRFGDIHTYPMAFHEVTQPIETMSYYIHVGLNPIVKIWRGR